MNVKITSADFKDWAREHRSLALAVCRAQAAAELTRARVDAYIKPIFESFGFVYSGELAESLDMRAGEKLVGKPLESEKDLYLCDDPAYRNTSTLATPRIERMATTTYPKAIAPRCEWNTYSLKHKAHSSNAPNLSPVSNDTCSSPETKTTSTSIF
jgi:hypothetical protein